MLEFEDELAGVLAGEQAPECGRERLDVAAHRVLDARQLTGGEPARHQLHGLGIPMGECGKGDAGHGGAPVQQRQIVARAHDRIGLVGLGDRPADDDSPTVGEAGECLVEDVSADVVEEHVDVSGVRSRNWSGKSSRL